MSCSSAVRADIRCRAQAPELTRTPCRPLALERRRPFDLALRYVGRGGILLPAIGLTLLVGIVSGLYPAFFLSRFQPAQVLKANRSAAETPGSGRLRTALVVAQFAVSIGLIICTAVVYGQTVYARSVDTGYQRDHILQVDNMNRYQLLSKIALTPVPFLVAAAVALGIAVATVVGHAVKVARATGGRQRGSPHLSSLKSCNPSLWSEAALGNRRHGHGLAGKSA